MPCPIIYQHYAKSNEKVVDTCGRNVQKTSSLGYFESFWFCPRELRVFSEIQTIAFKFSWAFIFMQKISLAELIPGKERNDKQTDTPPPIGI